MKISEFVNKLLVIIKIQSPPSSDPGGAGRAVVAGDRAAEGRVRKRVRFGGAEERLDDSVGAVLRGVVERRPARVERFGCRATESSHTSNSSENLEM